MDCRIPRENFVGTGTFTGPDGLTYPKVNIPSDYSDIHLAIVNFNQADVNGDVVVIKEQLYENYFNGEYTATELLNSITGLISTFVSDYVTTDSYYISAIDTSIKNMVNNYQSIQNEIDYNYIVSNFPLVTSYINGRQYIFSNSNYGIVIKQTEYGIDKILPFTIPITTVNSYDYQYIYNICYNEKRYSYFTLKAFTHPTFFKLIWLNNNFFTTNTNNIFDYSSYDYFVFNQYFTLVPGIYTKYGLLMGILQITNDLLTRVTNREFYLIPSLSSNDTLSIIALKSTLTNVITPDISNLITFENLSIPELSNYGILYSNVIYIQFNYDTNTFNIPIGRSFTTTPVNDMQGEITYSISTGILPDGLTFNTSTGIISGTPTTISTRQITITATNNTTTLNFDLTFNIIAEQYVYNSPINNITSNSQFTITPVNPPTSLFDGDLTFNNILINGMTFNNSTGIITGNSSILIKATIITINMTESLANTSMTYSQVIFIKSPKYYINLQDNIIIYE